MTHHLLFLRKADKRDVTAQIAAREGLTIMFVRTKHGADRLAKQLRGVGIDAGSLHGGKAQNNRVRTLAAFADGSTPVLVTTDVAARGIHVDGISLVVHVDPPGESKAYLHRAGRTARAGEDGVVVTLVTEEERGEVEKMTRKAGVDVDGVQVRPGDRKLAQITGAKQPSGVPIVAANSAVTVGDEGELRARRRGGPTGRRSGGGGRGAATGGRSGGAASGRGAGASTGGRGAGSGRSSGAGHAAGSAPTRATSSSASRTNGAGGSAQPASGRGAAPTTAFSGRSNSATGATSGFSGRSPGSGDTPGRPRRRAGRAEGVPGNRNRGAN